MNLNFLECFINLSKTLNFSQTARELKVAQPAVSRQIKSLEEELGASLFVRNRQGVYLTPEGVKLKNDIEPLYSRLSENLSSFKSETEALKGVVKFGCYREVGEKVFIPIISAFKKEFPDIIVKTNFMKAPDIIEDVKSGALDFGVTPASSSAENIRIYDIFQEDVVLVTRSGNKQKMGTLPTLPIVAYRTSDPLMVSYLKKYFPRFQLSQINYFATVNSHKSMVELLKTHDVWAVLPFPSVQQEINLGNIKVASPHTLLTKLYLAHYENPHMEKRKVVFKKFLLKNAKAYLNSGLVK